MKCLWILIGLLPLSQHQVVLPPGTRPIANPKDPCVEVKNISDVISMPQHKYMVLEHCLYYHVQQKNDELFRQPNSLVMLPPSNGDRQDNITVVIKSATLQHVWLNDMMKDLHIRGFFKIGWKDPRLAWDEQQFRVSSLRLQTPSHIWVPQIASIKHDSSVTNGDFVDFKRIETTNGGDVSAFLNFNLQTFCDVDLENFPNDVHHCCFYLQPKLYSDITDFRVRALPIQIDPQYYRKTGFGVDERQLKNGYDREGVATIQMCLDLSRSSTTLKVELAVPMAICAVLVLISPLFGALATQLHVKLFALLLQYLCLQFLANKTSQIGMGRATPRIFRFYEYTIAVNMLSILCTLIVSVLVRQTRKLPPSSGLYRVASLINSLLCCLSSTENEETPAITNDSVTGKAYKKDWDLVFSAVHVVLMLLVILIYLIGIIAIYC